MSNVGEHAHTNIASLRIEVMSASSDRRSWVHLVPSGTFSGRDGRGPFITLSAASVIKSTKSYHGKTQIVVDYEHQSINTKNNGKPAPAAGWIIDLDARRDGIWGLVEWTKEAAAQIASRQYRYLSPVFTHREDGTVVGIINVALTNSPNLDQLTAICRTEFPMSNDKIAELVANAAKVLGLPADTDAKAMIDVLRPLVQIATDLAALTGDEQLTPAENSARPDPAKYVPISEFERVVADANQLRQGVTEQAALSHVEDHIRRGVLAPFLKDWAVSLCKVNMPAFDSFAANTGPAFRAIIEPQTTRLSMNRRETERHALDETANAICSKMGLTAEEFTKARNDA
ncbi:hypothetical protein HB779_13420 [Phyllobacterium sp. 628]|uniref:phage protease n=1 Tax=Phyllobacterium sp. 628 TaxID=2718938 RepID=UPI0016621C74|nr:phage protease [Phyllobacterium sp. 628]QND52793.1 hypothetical protein HB779_13420 [Phyllobacterium sp. 628]